MASLLDAYDKPDIEAPFASPVFNINQQLEQKYGVALPLNQKEEEMTDLNPPEAPATIAAGVAHPSPTVKEFPNENLKRTREEFQEKPIQEIKKVQEEVKNAPGSDSAKWKEIKEASFAENEQANKIDTEEILKSQQHEPLKANSDGSLLVYWIDAYEDPNNQNEIYFIGKVLVGSKYSTCCIVVRDLQRCIYVVPKSLTKMEKPTDTEFIKIHEELENLRKKKFSSIKKWGVKPVSRNYHFELPILHGQNTFLKLKYPAIYPSLPSDLSGEFFSCIIGTTTSMLENVIVKRKLWGPGWIKIKEFKEATTKSSWCRHEIIVNGAKNIISSPDDQKREAPPLNLLAISVKHHKSKSGKNTIAMISCVMNENVNIEKPIQYDQLKYSFCSLVCPCDGAKLPFDIDKQSRIKKSKALFLPTEKNLLVTFLTKITQQDPDVIIGHDLYGYTLDLVISRLTAHNAISFSQIGRLKKVSLPKTYSAFQCRVATTGRLLCDTFISAKDMLPREANYSLNYLAKKQLGEDHIEFDPDMLPVFYNTSDKLLQLIEHTEKEAYFSMKLAHKLAILPLTKQLTNIAGHIWIRSLQNARAERNEMLLMHEFHDKKHIIPDKSYVSNKKKPGNFMEEEEVQEKMARKTRKKAAYEGGLVLDPQSGFYDQYILLLDFQSLYPSIIQEYNLCFTTVKRTPSQKLPQQKGTAGKEKTSEPQESHDADEIGKLPDKDIATGILPKVLENLVKRRREVKRQMANTKDPIVQQQCEIRQRALKLSANSMYGCLGFTNSRFYAKPIAALITKKGRDTLKKAYDLASQALNLQVIYGDTDSLMVNSNKDNLQEALKIAQSLKEGVNKEYKKLEIEIDGVFKSLLLLKKKKYAAIKLKNPFDEKVGTYMEIKGLDMVRRDWCPLTKVLCDEVLKLVLSGQNRENLARALTEKFADYGSRLQQGKIPLSQFIITKQLTKPTSEYKDGKRQPHVRVAEGLKKRGENEANLVNHFIPYVICKGDPHSQFAERAFHPDEVMRDKKLAIDIDYYANQQILPPLTRLLEYIREFNLDELPMHFGLDQKRHNAGITHEMNLFKEEDDMMPEGQNEEAEIPTAFKLFIKCPHCQKEYEMPKGETLKAAFDSIECTSVKK